MVKYLLLQKISLSIVTTFLSMKLGSPNQFLLFRVEIKNQ